MTTQDLLTMFRYNYSAVDINIDSISEDESLIRPKPAGNGVNWVLGHIVASRNRILSKIKEEKVFNSVEANPYRRGAGSEDMVELSSFSAVKAAFEASQKALEKGLSGLSDEELILYPEGEEAEKSDSTLGEVLTFLLFHETYHVGQLGLLRRLVGKDCAIK